ncbi:MAG: hypothetical protein NTU44_06520, partial [Bacteroidetes bacterium]|nr:hypothetical protein [Bacteroidota bacterium]
LRYDYYDPNTDLSGNQIGSVKYDKSSSKTTTVASTTTNGSMVVINKYKVSNSLTDKLSSGKADLVYSTLTLAWHYYFNDNIRITAAYAMPMNEKTINIKDTSKINGVDQTNDYSKVFTQNTFTLRIQAKF